MREEFGENHLSRVKDLSPGLSWDLSFKRYKNVMRYQGSHILALRRPSRTPAFSRKYVKGDPVHLIDWKSFARTDQMLIREQRDEASARIVICLDASDTMQWPDERLHEVLGVKVPSKWEIAVRVLLNLAYIHLNLGDTVRVYLWTRPESAAPDFQVPLATSSDVLKLYHIEEDRQFSISSLCEEGRKGDNSLPSGDYAYWISDGITRRSFDWLFERFRLTRMIQVLSSLETQVDWVSDEHCYFDEGIVKKEYLGAILKYGKAYRQKLETWQQEYRQKFRHAGGGYQLVTEQTPIATYMEDLLIFP